jgi:hypothetical protein
MKQHRVLFAVLTFTLLIAPAVHAQASRTWVSGGGDDNNPCSRTAPCQTFEGALAQTAAGGEISVLDAGGFGTVTITKAITINGAGTLTSILSAGTNGIVVNAGVNDKVVIRNVSINGTGNGTNGIRFLAGKDLTLENVTIEGFTGRGIDMSVTTTTKMFVKNTRISEGGTGIFITSSGPGSQAQALLDNVQLTGLTNGLEASLGGRATVTNSMISGNASNGILASNATSRINVDSCQISFNDVAGVNATASGSIIRLSDSAVVSNNAGISFAGGAVIETTGNNRVAGNVSSQSPLGTVTVQ